ncbi:MAG: hypothetical protein GHCLOJNM_02229 [bacterium]|nr:hypothetical protein [bacterium]
MWRVLEVALSRPDAPKWSERELAEAKEDLLARAREWLAEQPLDLSPAELSWGPIKMVYEKTGVHDPYAELKDRSNREALALLEEMREWIHTGEDPLETAARLAVAGNIIDLGIHKDYDIHESIRRILEEGFVIDDMERFREDLAGGETRGENPEVLYICDNAGEIAFDRLFIETLIEHFPRTRFTATVNGGPVLNDALQEDAEFVGLTDIVPVIDNGYDLLGTVLPACSPEFVEAFERADWVISKGQANYETLDGVSDKVVFLLKAKCEPIAAHVGVAIYQGVFKRGESLDRESSEALAGAACPPAR